MALPPTIPTAFVPHDSSLSERRLLRTDLGGLFDILSYVILLIVFVLALGVFVYGRVLTERQAVKDKALIVAEENIDSETIKEFVQLRDRLDSSKKLLKNHVVFSAFFTALGGILPVNVRFSSLSISVDETNTAKIQGVGVAKSFNTLAFASTAFATDKRIKDVIFSDIAINKDNSVSFSMQALLDPKLITYAP